MSFVLDGCARLAAGFTDAARTIAGNGNGDGDGPVPPDDHRSKLYRRMHQVPIAPPLLIPVSGNAVLATATDLLGPNTGYHWSVRRLNLSGYTAGNVTVYRNATQTGYGASAAVVGEILMPPSPAGTFTFGRGEMLLEPDDSMVLFASGITLTAGQTGITIIGTADQFESWLLPDYLM